MIFDVKIMYYKGGFFCGWYGYVVFFGDEIYFKRDFDFGGLFVYLICD